MSSKVLRALLVVAILGVAVGLAFLLSWLKPEPLERDVEELAPLVEVMELQTATADFSIDSQGTVRPRTETALSAEVSGSIVSVSDDFVAGGVFDAGEELLRIDPTSYDVAVDQAEALVRQRQIEFDGASRLRDSGYRAESEYASAAAALATAKAELVRARRDLAKTRVSLPYAGMVRSKEADIGQYVNPGTPLAVVFATDYAEVRLPLTDRELAFVELPAPGERVLEDGPRVVLSATRHGRQATWEARITRSEGVVDEATRVTWAVARIDDPYRLEHDGGTPLPMGTFVTARIDGVTVPDLIRVPRAALNGRDELVFVDGDDRLAVRTVDVLRADADHAWIEGGAEAGDRISLTALDTPVNGMRVRVAGETEEEADTLARTGAQPGE